MRAAPGKRRRPKRRARGLRGTLGVVLLAAAVPGGGFFWAGRKIAGTAAVLLSLGALGPLVWFAARDRQTVLLLVSDPVRLKAAAVMATIALVIWALVLVASYRAIRPSGQPRAQAFGGAVFVSVLCLVVAAPAVVAARYALVQADLVENVFQDNQSATTPQEPVTREDPWHGTERVNVLLLGGDGGIDRDGVRTDSMILASMDTRTGNTTTFSLPRNLMDAQFPENSPLHDLYPEGFAGEGDDGNWMLNAVYREVPLLHPGVLGRSDNEGADAIKMAVQGTLGVPVDYYLLINLAGFEKVVDAMGGVTVNINEPIPVGGNTDRGILPDYYLDPGPAQRLDGFRALWFARGRFGSTDYARMERQRCMVDAIITEARPLTLLRRYQALAAASKQIVRTDVPNTLLPALVDLASRMKQGRVRSVVFRPSAYFNSANPDFDWIRETVRKALKPPRRSSDTPASPSPTADPETAPGTPSPSASPTTDPGAAVPAEDSCGYAPVAADGGDSGEASTSLGN
ncbi:MAG: LCP family protein [Marmoricola sp.]